MYPINPFQNSAGIVAELREKPEFEACMALARSAENAVREDDADALMRLAVAYAIWRKRQPERETLEAISGYLLGAAAKERDHGLGLRQAATR